MELDTTQIKAYADFLEENSRQIVSVCNSLEESLGEALNFMDQKSAVMATRRMVGNIENIKESVKNNDGAYKRLILVLRRIQNAQDTFGGRSR